MLKPSCKSTVYMLAIDDPVPNFLTFRAFETFFFIAGRSMVSTQKQIQVNNNNIILIARKSII